MSEQVMQLIRMGLEVLEARMMMWITLIMSFVLFMLAISDPNPYKIACAVLWSIIIYLPMLKVTVGGSGGV
jgi:hypothetical protein